MLGYFCLLSLVDHRFSEDVLTLFFVEVLQTVHVVKEVIRDLSHNLFLQEVLLYAVCEPFMRKDFFNTIVMANPVSWVFLE